MIYINNKIIKYHYIAYFLIIFLLFSCKKHADTRKKCEFVPSNVNQTELLIGYLERHGDPANCKLTCTVTANDVYDHLDDNQYILDLRTKREFQAGHIRGAVHMPENKICYHLKEKMNPNRFKRVIIVCNTGQASTYVTALIRMAGYNNVYAMRWGMASWNKNFAAPWIDNHQFPGKNLLTTREFKITKSYDLPEIKTDALWRKDILIKQVRTQIAKGFKTYNIKASEIDFNAKNQLIIAYTSLEHYQKGHPVGAVHFEVKQSLNRKAQLLKIPPDANIIVYSDNGFESAYAVAYLNLLGYNAKTVCFGMNGFTPDSSYGFSLSQINNYNVVDIHNNLVFKEDKKPKFLPTKVPETKKAVTPTKKAEEPLYDEGC